MTAEPCAYPLFSRRFLQPLACGDGNAAAPLPLPILPPADAPAGPSSCAAAAAAAGDPALSPTKAAARMGGLRVLDLRALPRDDGPPTELRARKEKLAHYERQCSRVGEGLYVGAEWVAKSRAALDAAGITHVVNCVGFLYPPYHEPDLRYKTLYLQDTPGEDILCVLYDVFDFIEAALAQPGGRVLVHCSQGVSRSATLAIAYLMWKQNASYDGVFAEVKAARGVANPNIGFICQLLQWHKRRHAALDGCRLYRIAPHSAAAPQYLVAKPVAAPLGPASLDPRGAFVLHSAASLAVWAGAACPDKLLAAAHAFAGQLQRYEGAPGPAVLVRQGSEPEAFWACLAAAAAEGSGSRSGSPAAPGGGGAAAAAASAAALAAAAGGPVAVQENSAYDKDFELYARALSSRSSGGSGDSARSGGRKTPREALAEGAGSPNERLRKQARGELGGDGGDGGEQSLSRPPSPGKRRREPALDLTLEDLQPGLSTDSAAHQLGKKERTLQEATSPCPGRTTSDLVLASAAASEASSMLTPRSRGGEEVTILGLPAHLQQGRRRQQQQQQQQQQPGGLGGTEAGGGGGGGGTKVPLLRLPIPSRLSR